MTARDEIKQKADIVATLSQYGVKLEKSGRNYKALCPFHSEKHGSFFVFPEQQSWHCFGACATGGDVISFVMKKEGVDYGQALRLLAERTGVRLTKASREEDAARDRLFDLNAKAAEFFHHALKTPGGDPAYQYVLKRGLDDATITAFQLGYAPEGWDTLKNHLAAKGCQEKDLISSGLTVERAGGGSYDRFRNRLMFPIRDAQGRITGFGGRALDDSSPKYMNSPQSAVFDKGSTLYGIDRAAPAIKGQDRAVIVEGYMDVIMAHQYHYENVVASMGTSLTDRQAAILRKLTRRITLALDPDSAGKEATLRGIQVIDNELNRDDRPAERGMALREARQEIELSIMTLPADKDPDEVIKEGPQEWDRLIESAVPAMDYVLNVAASRVDLRTPQGKKAMVDQALPAVAAIAEPVKRSTYLKKLADLVGLKEQDLWDAARRLRTRDTRRLAQPAQASVSTTLFANPVEEYCLSLLIQNPDLKQECAGLSLDYFDDSSVREIAAQWLASGEPASFMQALDPSLRDLAEHLASKQLPEANTTARRYHLLDSIHQLHERWAKNLQSKRAMVLLQEAGDQETEIQKLEEHGDAVPRQLNELFHQPKGKQRLRPTGNKPS